MTEHDAAEAQAMRAHYAARAADKPHTPEDPDALRDGLLAGWRAVRSARA
jgi:hypothetical protein